MALNATCIMLEFLLSLSYPPFLKANVDYVLRGFLWTEVTRSANSVVTWYCREEDHLALSINNTGCNGTCMPHTALPPFCLLQLSIWATHPSPWALPQAGRKLLGAGWSWLLSKASVLPASPPASEGPSLGPESRLVTPDGGSGSR